LWITADLHYTAAHYYDPNRAVFQDFEPFWEFVSGPLHAGTWTPTPMDRSFGPQVVFHKASSREQGDNLAPCYGLQFFGQVAIDGATGGLTVALKDVGDRVLWSTTLDPAPVAAAPMTTMSLQPSVIPRRGRSPRDRNDNIASPPKLTIYRSPSRAPRGP